MKISKMASKIEPSLTRKLFNMAQKYDNVIDLTLGDPDMPAPEKIKKAACDAIKDNMTRYSANAGLLSVRKSVSNRVNKIWGVNSSVDNVMLTVGGMEALYLSLLCTVEEGDEVIIFAPYYVNYVQMVTMCGGMPVIIDAYGKNGFEIDRGKLLEKITEKTVAVIINSPNNPTGDVLSEEFLKIVYEVASEKDLYIISDEVYRTLTYDSLIPKSVLKFSGAAERTILIDSMSKEYSMTGWRIGYAWANAQLIKEMIKMQENIAACVSLPSQYAMLYAYENDVDNGYIVEEFEKRGNFLYDRILKIEKLHCIKPKGTFYMFVNIEETGLNSEEFAERLLLEKQVAVVPGIAYGKDYDSYVRVAFTKSIETLAEALNKIEEFVKHI